MHLELYDEIAIGPALVNIKIKKAKREEDEAAKAKAELAEKAAKKAATAKKHRSCGR